MEKINNKILIASYVLLFISIILILLTYFFNGFESFKWWFN